MGRGEGKWGGREAREGKWGGRVSGGRRVNGEGGRPEVKWGGREAGG